MLIDMESRVEICHVNSNSGRRLHHERERGTKEIMATNFLELMKDSNPQIQKVLVTVKQSSKYKTTHSDITEECQRKEILNIIRGDKDCPQKNNNQMNNNIWKIVSYCFLTVQREK